LGWYKGLVFYWTLFQAENVCVEDSAKSVFNSESRVIFLEIIPTDPYRICS